MSLLTFEILEDRYGEAAAYHYLQEIEKASGICIADTVHVDPERRLAKACNAQDDYLEYAALASTDLYDVITLERVSRGD